MPPTSASQWSHTHGRVCEHWGRDIPRGDPRSRRPAAASHARQPGIGPPVRHHHAATWRRATLLPRECRADVRSRPEANGTPHPRTRRSTSSRWRRARSSTARARSRSSVALALRSRADSWLRRVTSAGSSPGDDPAGGGHGGGAARPSRYPREGWEPAPRVDRRGARRHGGAPRDPVLAGNGAARSPLEAPATSARTRSAAAPSRSGRWRRPPSRAGRAA